MKNKLNTAEHRRLRDSLARTADWKNWGPYLSERSWGTVREAYGEEDRVWEFFPHDHARSRAYRWNEDGLAGVCNRFQNICLAVALWNGQDPILKERLFGLSGKEGNHGEDVKEYYYYLDSTPTHSYMKMLYKYPQAEFPYAELIEQNRSRGRELPELELIELLPEVFEDGRYFDVVIEYAKAGPDDLLCRISATNRGPDRATIHVLPHLWYRNTWSWGYQTERPELHGTGTSSIYTKHRHLGERRWYAHADGQRPQLLFTENETNSERLFGFRNASPYVKDAFHRAVVEGERSAVNPSQVGSKAAAHFQAIVAPGETFTVLTRFSNTSLDEPFKKAGAIFDQRIAEADKFYAAVQHPDLNDDQRLVQRQAFAGLMWNKQFYHYSVELWLKGDPAQPAPPPDRLRGRNSTWEHLYNLDVISMPDKWEYPWYAAWDLAFHALPIALIDPEWAKRQIVLMLREWYMHPNGQIPAYEWNFSDVNPPVHAWAAWRVYKIARNVTGEADTDFLEEVFHKMLLNFTWWVNRKDRDGLNIFEGGFLGLDNIGVFDRSRPLPHAGRLEQADGTAWMGMYCLNMLAMALELARTRPAYEAVATKFFEHFIYIAHAINGSGGSQGLWNDEDGFYYDRVHMADGASEMLKVRSFVGLIPLFAVETLEPDLLELLPHFRRRMEWFIKYRPALLESIAPLTSPGEGGRRLLTLVDRNKLERILPRLVDPSQFFSDYGLRSLSRMHLHEPFVLSCNGETLSVSYEPAESRSWMFGGNSNWRGPIWFPVNFLMIESLEKYYHYFGDAIQVECPRYSDRWQNLEGVAEEIARRLTRIFLRDPETGRRAVLGDTRLFQEDPHWRDHIPFFEYFHGETGAGLGASHQTGWTALVAKLLNPKSL